MHTSSVRVVAAIGQLRGVVVNFVLRCAAEGRLRGRSVPRVPRRGIGVPVSLVAVGLVALVAATGAVLASSASAQACPGKVANHSDDFPVL